MVYPEGGVVVAEGPLGPSSAGLGTHRSVPPPCFPSRGSRGLAVGDQAAHPPSILDEWDSFGYVTKGKRSMGIVPFPSCGHCPLAVPL